MRQISILTSILSISFSFSLSLASTPQPLKLDAYLEQVQKGNTSFTGAQIASEAALLKEDEADLLVYPSLFAVAENKNDEKETSNPTSTGTKTLTETYQLGLSQTTTIGLQGRLYYNLSRTSIAGSTLLEPKYFQAAPTIELTQSLWRNGFGSETRATVEAIESQARAQKFSERFEIKGLLAKAEGAYWHLALARAAYESQKEILKHSEEILAWVRKQSNLKLAENSDLYQAQAAVAGRRIETDRTETEMRSAERTFNTMRGVESDQVVEQLVLPTDEELLTRPTPQHAGARDDFKALKYQMRAAKAQSISYRERAKPQLDIYFTHSQNGRDPVSDEAVSEAEQGDHPTTAVGVKFTTSLDFGNALDTQSSYDKLARAAELRLKQMTFEHERLWQDLVTRFEQTRSRLKLAIEFEAVQKEKLENEKLRHRRGRSTTYQVLVFEQDFANSRLATIRTQQELLELHAQLRTFGGAE